ncbi:unnamed protein product [Knipowitschia caucasica]|uniref:Uncharacterized protein n=1 Tax=Knipowitschia caucasica TaxID=637954 RepID=A0AAV2LFP2_KNICA
MKLFFRIAGVLLLLTGTIADFDLSDALDDDNPKATEPPAPPKTNDDFGLDLSDALGGDDPVPPKPPVVNKPSGGGSGGTIKDSDLFDIGGYEPEGGKYDGNGGGAGDSGYNSNSGGDQPVQDADFEWGPLLKMINANVPEEFFKWIGSVRNQITPVLERFLDLLYSLPSDDKQEL